MSKKIIQTLDLKNDPELIDFYEKAHSPSQIWPEIVKGIKEVGILNMEIYREGTRLVMIMEVPDDFDFDKSMTELATLERQAEWEEYVGKAQMCADNSTSSEKWRRMGKIFSLTDCGGDLSTSE